MYQPPSQPSAPSSSFSFSQCGERGRLSRQRHGQRLSQSPSSSFQFGASTRRLSSLSSAISFDIDSVTRVVGGEGRVNPRVFRCSDERRDVAWRAAGWRGRLQVESGLRFVACGCQLQRQTKIWITPTTSLVTSPFIHTIPTRRGGVPALDGARHACRAVSMRGGEPWSQDTGGGELRSVFRCRFPLEPSFEFEAVGLHQAKTPLSLPVPATGRLLPSSSCSLKIHAGLQHCREYGKGHVRPRCVRQ